MDASHKLGQKLLQGWTMLGDSCSICNSPLMRSRDGSQIICVVCEPKEEIKKANEPVTTASIESFSTKTESGKNRLFYSNKAAKALLELLDNSLTLVQPVCTFCDILQSALSPLRSLNFSVDPNILPIIDSIRNKITGRLCANCDSSDPAKVIAHFNLAERLIKLQNEFEEIIKQ